MENASKALLMSGSVLIAILILVIATRVFDAASGVAKTYDDKMDTVQISSFNANFTKFMGAVVDENTNVEKQKYATIHDVISTANFAYDNNRKMVIDPTAPEYIDDPALVRVDLESFDKSIKINHIENLHEIYDILIKDCYYQDNKYPNASNIVTYEITINETNQAGKICHVTFTSTVGTTSNNEGLLKARQKANLP